MVKTTQTIKERIHDEILKDVINGEYPANTIISERMLIEKYQVSKSPIREALVELCNENILNSIPRSGYQVIPITLRELNEMIDLRLVIELAAFEKYFEHLNDKMIEALEKHEADSSFIMDTHDVVKNWTNNIKFHLLLCRFSDNRWLYQVLEMSLTYCSRGARQYYFDNWNASDKMYHVDGTRHLQFISELKAKNYENSKAILKQDILSMRDTLLNLY